MIVPQQILELAQDAFWESIAKSYPHIRTGDFPPDATYKFNLACERAVEVWLESNDPTEAV